ncbi:DUF4286 family protein [Vicingaceae bacterium]|nr:DUF4286 family protein [Vicingaceae bacterium]MDA9782941.1 DUF4286 family protein [Vicingaceae bacterium]MDB4062073.1 DUF4286 family protein [Vicingaceae bacterium]MDB4083219.1 DUF4286 family protein [Vicingaceae bacterium]
MIVYSVTVNIDSSIHEDWLTWMKNKHIPDVMDTGYFTEYRMLKVISRQEDEEGISYNIQYTCASMADLHQYQAQKAPALQKEHEARYTGKFAAFRTLLEFA